MKKKLKRKAQIVRPGSVTLASSPGGPVPLLASRARSSDEDSRMSRKVVYPGRSLPAGAVGACGELSELSGACATAGDMNKFVWLE